MRLDTRTVQTENPILIEGRLFFPANRRQRAFDHNIMSFFHNICMIKLLSNDLSSPFGSFREFSRGSAVIHLPFPHRDGISTNSRRYTRTAAIYHGIAATDRPSIAVSFPSGGSPHDDISYSSGGCCIIISGLPRQRV